MFELTYYFFQHNHYPSTKNLSDQDSSKGLFSPCGKAKFQPVL